MARERGKRIYLRADELAAVDHALAQMLAGLIDGVDEEDEEAIVAAAMRAQEKL